LSQLDHERIVFFHDAFEKKNAVIMVMELVPSPSCFPQVRSYMRQVLEGICYLHQQKVLHLDIKVSAGLFRICDFGNAQELTPDEPQYCKYGTPEFVGPEIVNQSPISSVTDVWPVGVIAYLCLTGISPFVGENDKTTLMNIRNYNVAFEERMFQGLTREAKGFPNIPSSLLQEDGSIAGRQHAHSESGRVQGEGARALLRTHRPSLQLCSSPCPYAPLCSPDFPPVFHIKLKDQVLLEGDALTLCCLPAGSPTPRIIWMKDKRSLQSDNTLNIVSCKDGRQMLTIPKVSRKDAGLYECAAANTLGTAISSCTLAVARKDAGDTSGDREEEPLGPRAAGGRCWEGRRTCLREGGRM
uniref:Protein kinase domain-containing protein n=1 Tax=Nothoprocta perdicaria TaxID=30464 RepID=A0A8C7EBH0_NOTPE